MNKIDFKNSLVWWKNYSERLYNEVQNIKNVSGSTTHLYGELLAFKGNNNVSGWKQSIVLGAGDTYTIGDSYEYTSGETGKHFHRAGASIDFNSNVVAYDDFKLRGQGTISIERDYSSKYKTILGLDKSSYFTFNHRITLKHKNEDDSKNIGINKVSIDYTVDYYEYVGGTFFQDPYTLQYYGEPDPDYYEYCGITEQSFKTDIEKDIIKFNSNKDSFSHEIRTNIGQIEYDIMLCSKKILPVYSIEEYKEKEDEFDFDKESIILRQDLNKWMSINKHYVIEHSTKWRNEFNFSPNKEFLPELEYGDVGGHQSSDFTYFSNFFIKENSN